MHGNFVVKDLVTEKLLLEVTPKEADPPRKAYTWLDHSGQACSRKEGGMRFACG